MSTEMCTFLKCIELDFAVLCAIIQDEHSKGSSTQWEGMNGHRGYKLCFSSLTLLSDIQ